MTLPINHPYPLRQVKSWVRRASGLSITEKQFLETTDFALGSPLEFHETIAQYRNNNCPIFIDIGCGDGQSAIQLASENPTACIIGVETHTPGIARGLMKAKEVGLGNLYMFHGDIWEIFDSKTDQIFDRVHLYFSDPWPKSRHHKRRLIQEEFLLTLKNYLLESSVLHIATDWQPYAEHIQEVLNNLQQHFIFSSVHLPSMGKEFKRIPTKYERRGILKGHCISEFYIQSKRESQLSDQ